jgi:hypothetical protein
MGKINDNSVSPYTKQFLEKELQKYPEIIDTRELSTKDYLWHQSRRAFILNALKRLEQQDMTAKDISDDNDS